nr:MAG TPA: LPXTG cell wall anchor motif domain protein [Caudoviricetes sp.]
MKIKITATMAVLAGLLIAPSVLASEVTKDGTEITVTEPPAPSAKEEPKNAVESKLETSAKELPKTGEAGNILLPIIGVIAVIGTVIIWRDKEK